MCRMAALSLCILASCTTQRWQPGMLEEDTRFFGLKRECGLHFDDEVQTERAA